jgi:uncharacterized membrane protein YkvA (DUF1232 family)
MLAGFRRYFLFYRLLARHARTPGVSKVLPWVALLYFLSPIDLIPDLLPLLGQLDDLTVIPLLLFMAIKFIPRMVRQDAWKEAEKEVIDVEPVRNV